ncbi:sphingosine kinase 1-like [Limulus polyphemus]|uniref:Sphingosine kinase 1-like n=1 Tax=Limulus polyphemus TaxID=6850 RepID=A0ABM1BJ32_LIMPO|nr:sphingosine kinase 1-like [Limulus polyphemus]
MEDLESEDVSSCLSMPSSSALLEDMFVLHNTNSVVNVKLTQKNIVLEHVSPAKNNRHEEIVIEISDIVGCHIMKEKKRTRKESLSLGRSIFLCLYSYPLRFRGKLLQKQLQRIRETITLEINKHKEEEENVNVAKRWQKALLWLLKSGEIVDLQGIQELPPQRNLLVFVNPRSGPGRALQIFRERVVPVLAESDIKYKLVVTDRSNCARDFVKTQNLATWNGVVVVSGDGLLYEVYNKSSVLLVSLSVNKKLDNNSCGKKFLNFHREPYVGKTVISSVLNVIHGRVSPMDLVRVSTAKETVYSFLSIGWGIMADIDIESEKLRAIGEARFGLWAIVRSIGLRKYSGRLSYLPVDGYLPKATKQLISQYRMKRSVTSGGSDYVTTSHEERNSSIKNKIQQMVRSKSLNFTLEEQRSKKSMSKVFMNKKSSDSSSLENSNSSSDFMVEPEKTYLSGDEGTMTHQSEIQPTGACSGQIETKSVQSTSWSEAPELPVVTLNDESYDIPTVCEKTCNDTAQSSLLPPINQPLPSNWVVVEGDFIVVYASHQTHLGTDVFFAPNAKLDDGLMWLVIIQAGVSRVQVINFLLSLQNGKHVDIPYVTMIPVRAFRLEPFSADGYMTIDGEAVDCVPLQAEVLPSLTRIMTR